MQDQPVIDKSFVERRAYEVYAARGYIDGRDLDDWLTAERDLLLEAGVEPQQSQSAGNAGGAEVVGGRRIRVLVALDTSDVGESAAAAIGAWSRSVPMEVQLLSVIHPEHVDATQESASQGEFSTAEGAQAGRVQPTESIQSGAVAAPIGDPRPMTVEDRGQALERARSEREDYLRRIALRQLSSSETTVLVVFSDKTADTIVETARAIGADTIAMGTHGTSGIRHAFGGSVAERVMRQSPVPVVLIGPEAHAAFGPLS